MDHNSLGSAVVKGVFGNKSYDLQVTTLQAMLLLSFNEDTSFSFSALHNMLNMPEDILKRVLHSLSCGKFKILLRLQPESSDIKEKGIRITDSFVVNMHFS
jgi:cullin 1